MIKSTRIQYTYFVGTVQLELADKWGASQATGGYVIDTGAWRDCNPREAKGIEFEFEHDAVTFLHRCGGTLEERSPGKDLGINH